MDAGTSSVQESLKEIQSEPIAAQALLSLYPVTTNLWFLIGCRSVVIKRVSQLARQVGGHFIALVRQDYLCVGLITVGGEKKKKEKEKGRSCVKNTEFPLSLQLLLVHVVHHFVSHKSRCFRSNSKRCFLKTHCVLFLINGGHFAQQISPQIPNEKNQ